MKITRSDGQRLVIVHFPWITGIFILIIAGGLVAQAGMACWHGKALTRDEMICVGIGSIMVLGVAVFTRRSVFSFDRAGRQMEWTRTGIFGRKAGIIPFYQIKSADTETMAGDRGGTCYRVSLTLSEGEFPLTLAYSSGIEKKCRTVCDAINGALGLSVEIAATNEEADLRALVRSGRLIDAIARVRQARKCTIAEAKDYVESLR